MAGGGATPQLRRDAAPAQFRRPWVRYARAAGLLAAVALAVLGAARLLIPKVRDLQPEELKTFMARASEAARELPQGEAEDAEARARALAAHLPLEKAIQQINRLGAEERREVMRSLEAQRYLQELRPEERVRLVRETLDRGVYVMVERYRSLTAEQKRQELDRIRALQAEGRARLDAATPEERRRMAEFVNSGDFDHLLDRAVKAYLSLTTSQERAELAPLFDAAFENLRYAREKLR